MTIILSNPFQNAYNFWSWNYKINESKDEALLALSLILLAISWYAWVFLKISKTAPPLPPGPKGLPLVGNLFSLDPELHSYLAGLARTHGPILTLRLGMKVGVVVTSPEVARKVLKDHDSTFANRDTPSTSRTSEHGPTDIVWSPHGPRWQMLRKVTAHGMLGSKALNAGCGIREREIRNTIGYFYSQVGSPINVGEQMFLTVLNVITNMLWGGTVQGKERESIGAEFRQVVGEVTALLGKPDMSDFFPGLGWLDLQGNKRKMENLLNKLDVIFEKIIDQRVKMGGKQRGGDENGIKDFLQVLLEEKEKDVKIPLTMDNIKSLLMDMVVGGTDTSSNTVEFALAEMMNKPQIMKKAQKELDVVVGKNNRVEESHIQKLPYLNMITKEVLRLHPSLPLMVPHCPSESRVISGYTVPKGARVFVNVWAIQRNSSIWKDPLDFYPERFLSGDKGDYSGNDFNYFPFGSGRRICAGIAMAERMVMFLLASLVHSFEWKLVEGETLDLSEKFGIVLKKKVPLVAIPSPRLSNPSLYKV